MNYHTLQEENILKGHAIKIILDSDIYTKSTLLKSTYKFTDKAYIFIQNDASDKKQFIVYFTSKDNTVDLSDLSGEFMNELLDQELRSVVLSETQKIRDVIVTRALLSGQSNE